MSRVTPHASRGVWGQEIFGFLCSEIASGAISLDGGKLVSSLPIDMSFS